jgi:hypothetical protein
MRSLGDTSIKLWRCRNLWRVRCKGSWGRRSPSPCRTTSAAASSSYSCRPLKGPARACSPRYSMLCWQGTPPCNAQWGRWVYDERPQALAWPGGGRYMFFCSPTLKRPSPPPPPLMLQNGKPLHFDGWKSSKLLAAVLLKGRAIFLCIDPQYPLSVLHLS